MKQKQISKRRVCDAILTEARDLGISHKKLQKGADITENQMDNIKHGSISYQAAIRCMNFLEIDPTSYRKDLGYLPEERKDTGVPRAKKVVEQPTLFDNEVCEDEMSESVNAHTLQELMDSLNEMEKVINEMKVACYKAIFLEELLNEND